MNLFQRNELYWGKDFQEKLASKTLNDQGFFDSGNYAAQIDSYLKIIYLELKKDKKIDING